MVASRTPRVKAAWEPAEAGARVAARVAAGAPAAVKAGAEAEVPGRDGAGSIQKLTIYRNY